MSSELHGFLLVYVDDILILAPRRILEETTKAIQKEWQTSDPEFLTRGKVKHLGMELCETEAGFFAGQEDYVKDHLNAMNVLPKEQKVPTIRDMYPEAEETVDPDWVRKAQQVVGELLWLRTRTRPEISFSVSRCSQEIIRAPRWVCSLGEVVWGYLRATEADGLSWFWKQKGESWEGLTLAGVQVFTDISFSPSGSGAISHGCIMVTYNQGLMWWKCSRQAFPTLSTAEAELVEAMEGMALGDAVDSLLLEHEPEHVKRVWVDNSAAVSKLSLGPCAWRTRHLRLRSHHLRWRLASADWLVGFLPGRFQLADLGTKALPDQRVQELKKLLGMGHARSEKHEEKQDEIDVKILKKFGRSGAMILGATILKGVDQDDTYDAAHEGSDYFVAMFLVIYTVLVALATLVVQSLARSAVRRYREAVRTSRSSSDGDDRGEELRGVWRAPGPIESVAGDGAHGGRERQPGLRDGAGVPRGVERDLLPGEGHGVDGGAVDLGAGRDGLRRRGRGAAGARGGDPDGEELAMRTSSDERSATVEYASPDVEAAGAPPGVAVVFNVFGSEVRGLRGEAAGPAPSLTMPNVPMMMVQKPPPPRLPWALQLSLSITRSGEKYHTRFTCRCLVRSEPVEHDLCLGCFDHVHGDWKGRV